MNNRKENQEMERKVMFLMLIFEVERQSASRVRAEREGHHRRLAPGSELCIQSPT